MLRLLRDGGFVVFLGGLIALVGCGGGGGDAESGDKPAAAEKEAPAKGLKQVDVAKLPKVGDSLPPQDNGRVEPAPPEGWKAAPRDQNEPNVVPTRLTVRSILPSPSKSPFAADK